MENKKMIKGYLLVVLSAIIFGLMPLMAKFIYAEGVNSITLVFDESIGINAIVSSLISYFIKIPPK